MSQYFLPCLLAWVILMGCHPLSIPSTPIPATSPTISPPPPSTTSSWQCYGGGIDCYHGFLAVRMVDETQGWLANERAAFKFSLSPQGTLVWEESPCEYGARSLHIISANAWWGANLTGISSCKNGLFEHVSGSGTSLNGAEDLVMVSPDEGWTVGEQGVIMHYTQGQLAAVPTPTTDRLTAIFMLNATEGWAVGYNNVILHYHNGQWEKDKSVSIGPYGGLGPDLTDIEMVSHQEGWAVGHTLYHYQENVWQEIPNTLFEEGHTLQEVSLVTPNEGWAVGSMGVIYHYANNQWQRVESPTTNTLYSIDMINPDEGWAAGQNSTLLHYHQGEWTVVSETSPPPTLNALSWVEDEGWAVESTDTIMHYQNGMWQPVETFLTPTTQLRAIDMVDKDNGWAVGDQGMIVRYQNNNWHVVSSPTTMNLSGLSGSR